MKKSLLILSMMAVAATASAFDTPVAGTADKPNYYIIKSNRGVPYLGYTAEGVTTNNGTTNLHLTNELTTANVWAVTPGTTEGTVVIKNYTADAYLLKYFKADEDNTVSANATATTVNTPTELVLTDMGGAYAISLTSDQAATYPNNCISLDASGGATCGNYVPTSAQGPEGGCWWFTKVTPAEGQSMEDAVVEVKLTPEVKAATEEAAAWLEAFIPNVPQAQAQLQAGIEQLKALPVTTDYATKITDIKNATIAAANEALATAFTDGTYAIKNLRRVTTATEGAYLAVNTANSNYVGSTSYTSDVARFTFIKADSGYKIYNPGTQTYIGTVTVTDANGYKSTVCTPVDEAGAQIFRVAIQDGAFTHGDNNYHIPGVALVSDAAPGNGINWQSWNNGTVSIYAITDGGSIFSIKPADDATIVAEATATVESALTPYLANVPASVKTILNNAIAEAKALTFSADIFVRAEAIRAKAIADANTELATALDNKVYALKYLRGGDFVNCLNNNFVHTDESTAATAGTAQFTFKSTGNGGYKIYNAAAQSYIGGSDAITLVPEETSAVVVYPALVQSTPSGYCGITLSFNADHSGYGVNMNSGDGLHSWSANDDGSVWGLIEPATITGIESVPAVEKVAVEGIYDLSGRKLSAPVRGINIINGKKVFIR